MFGVVGTTLAIGLASGCDDGQSAKARAPFSELFFARPAHGWGPFASERSSNCAQSGPCSRARAMASNKYACGESQLAVETLTHAPITPSSGFDTEAAPVTVRGHPGHLAKFTLLTSNSSGRRHPMSEFACGLRTCRTQHPRYSLSPVDFLSDGGVRMHRERDRVRRAANRSATSGSPSHRVHATERQIWRGQPSRPSCCICFKASPMPHRSTT
jgi:hypothetical protein